MAEVRNLNQKLVGAISKDKQMFEIHIKDCVTRIKIRTDGTLGVTHRKSATKLPQIKNN